MTFIPGWDSVEAASRWHRGFELAGFVALGLLLIFEILAYIYGNHRDALVQVRDAEVAEQRRRQQERKDNEAQNKIDEANKAASGARDELRELQRAQEPRNISEAEMKTIAAYLKNSAKGSMVIKASVVSPDARVYAEQIADILRTEGWNVRIDNAMFTGPATSGLWITVKNGQAAPVAAATLKEAFDKARIPIRAVYDPMLPEETDGFWLSVGSK